MLGISEGLPDQTMPPLGQPSLIRRRSEERERELSRPGSGLKRTIPGLENIQELSEALEMSSVAKFTKSRRTGPVFCPSSPSGAMVELLARSFEDPNPCPKIEISVRTRAEDVASNRTSPKGSSSPQGAAGEPMDPYMMRSSVADGDFDFTASDYYGVVTSSSPATAAREEEKETTAGDGAGGMAQPSLVQESHYHRPSHAQQGVRIHANKTLYAGTIYRRVREGSPAEYTFNFRKFWGILIGAELYFFESAGSTTQLDKLLLIGCRIDALSGLNDLQWKLSFPKRGQTEDFTEFFRADSSQEMRDWVAAIGTAASAKIISSPSASRPWRLSRDQPATRVILVRHGHYINAGSKATDAEKVLSEMGRKQAQLTADFLQRHGYNKRNRSVAIEYSTLTRARETAEIIASLFGGNDLLESSDLLIEGWPGQPFPIPGLPSPNEAKQSNSAPHSPALERMQVKQMVENLRLMKSFHTYFVREADEPDDMLKIIVCHANIIRYFICKVLGVPYLGVWGQMEIDHCSLTRVDVYNDGTMKLISMNEVGHLPENLQTSSKDHI